MKHWLYQAAPWCNSVIQSVCVRGIKQNFVPSRPEALVSTGLRKNNNNTAALYLALSLFTPSFTVCLRGAALLRHHLLDHCLDLQAQRVSADGEAQCRRACREHRQGHGLKPWLTTAPVPVSSRVMQLCKWAPRRGCQQPGQITHM